MTKSNKLNSTHIGRTKQTKWGQDAFFIRMTEKNIFGGQLFLQKKSFCVPMDVEGDKMVNRL